MWFARPRVVGSERPYMAFQISTSKSAAAVIFVLDIHHDLRACRLRASVDGIGVADNHVNGLRLATADFVRLLHQLAIRIIVDRAEHDHTIPIRQFGMSNRVPFARINGMLLESENFAKPRNGGQRIAVTKARDHCGDQPFWRFGHGYFLCGG